MSLPSAKTKGTPEPSSDSRDVAVDGEACPYPRPETDFSNWERLTLSDSRNLLRVLRLLSRKFSLGSVTEAIHALNADELRAEMEYYRSNDFRKRPNSFFRKPKELPKVCLSTPHPLSRGEIVDLLFRSHFTPKYRPFVSEFESFRDNQNVHARMWRHPNNEHLGTVIAIHGWFMGDQRINALTMMPGYFFRLGLNVILYELPYHGRRAPAASSDISLFPSARLARTNEGFAQAIFELRALAKWVASEDDKPLGAVGMSLGGYTAALWGSLDPLAFVVPVVPLVSIADMVWPILYETEKARHEMGLELEDLRAMYAVHCPLSYRPKVPLERRMIIAGTGDPIIPDTQPKQLWEHWDHARIHWFAGSHLGQIVESEALSHVRDFLRGLNLAHNDLLEVE